MNRDDILKMEAGHDTDALVATKVMNYRIIRNSMGLVVVESIGHLPYVFNPSTSISAAWEVLFQLRKIDKHWSPTIQWYDDDGDSDGWWEINIFYYGETEDEYQWHEVYANTNEEIPLAICKVCLLAVEDK